MRVLDRDGAEGVTMRQVAAEIGVSPASLYGHVANKEELIQLVLDRIMAETPVVKADERPWEDQVKEFARRVREVFLAHPGSAALTLGRVPLGPNLVERLEGLLGMLRGSGIPDQMAAFAGDLLGLYVGAHAYEESVAQGQDRQEMAAMVDQWFASLPAERFPNLRVLAGNMASGSSADRFEWGLDVLVRGLASFAQPAAGAGHGVLSPRSRRRSGAGSAATRRASAPPRRSSGVRRTPPR